MTGTWRAERVSASSLEPHRTRILNRVPAASVEKEGKEEAATPPRAVWFGFPYLPAFPPSESLYPGASGCQKLFEPKATSLAQQWGTHERVCMWIITC